MKNTARVLVTGGAGFLDSTLCDRLLDDGCEVICADNFFTGRRGNIAHLLGNPRFELIRHDVTFPRYVEIDQTYNLACPVSPVHYQHNPVQTTMTNVHGAINVLGLVKRTGAKIFQASTSEIYGDAKIHPQNEEHWVNVIPIGPLSCYGKAQRCAETLFFDNHRQFRTRIKVARIFNTYGARMRPDDGRVVSNLIIKALANQPITVYGDGRQTRSFCFVGDLIEGIVRLMASPDEVTWPLNLGNPFEITMIELAEKVIAMTGSGSPIVYQPLPVDDPQQRRPYITRANEVLSWSPQIALDDGLKRTIEYFEGSLRDSGDLLRPASVSGLGQLKMAEA